jgi:hypothetical protein
MLRFLFRIIAWMLLIALAFRLLRRVAARRRKEATLPPDSNPRPSSRPDRIEDATFTEISDK